MAGLLAYYGTGRTYVDVTARLDAFVQQPSPDVPPVLVVPANTDFNRVFGDPVFGKVKRLVLIDPVTRMYTHIAERSLVIHRTITAADLTTPLDEFVSAAYGARNVMMDVTEQVRQRYLDANRMVLRVPAHTRFNVDFGRDPIPHHKKRLVVQFTSGSVVLDEYADTATETTVYAFDIKQTKLPMYVYVHIATLNNWFDLFREIIERIQAAGLYDVVTQVRLGFLGSDQDLQRVMDYIADKPKVAVHVRGTTLNTYERLTLHALRDDAGREDFYALYVHTKGVTKYGTPMYGPVKDWVDFMHYFLITEFTKTITAFEQTNAVTTGVNYRRKPKHHYSGNIWWAKSSYIRTLSPRIGPAYLDPEMWILSGRGAALVLFEGKEVGYKRRFPAHLYTSSPLLNQTVVH